MNPAFRNVEGSPDVHGKELIYSNGKSYRISC